MPEARVTEVCDAVVAAVAALWTPAAPNAVERTYLTPVEPGDLAGRQVWVTPASFADEPASRGEDLGQYTVAVVVAERYADGGAVPRGWMDERVLFVESLFDLLGNYGQRRASGWLSVGTPARRHFTERAAVPAVYDWEFLSGDHCFWAELEFDFREVRG